MIRPRTVKMWRDLNVARGRVAVMVVAIAVALSGVGALLIARTVILREAAAAYAATNPAAATLDVEGGVDAALLAGVRARPDVTDATARQTVTTRVRVGGEWRRMLLFVIAPDDPLRIATFSAEPGAWPPADTGLLIERAALPVLGAAVGDDLAIAGPDGTTRSLSIAGTAYDPALAPAGQERTGYGYLTPQALTRLGFTPLADELRLTTTSRDQATAETTATGVSAWLTMQGREVHLIQVPPYRHPHQNQTDTITSLFLAFALAALILAGVLVAATLGGMLAAQTRQIGVMKTVGATTGQLLRMYLLAVTAIAAAATVLAAGPALLAGYGLSGLVAELLNVDIASRAVPWWVPVTYTAAGIAIPLLVASVPLLRATRITVRTALDDHGGGQAGTRRTDRWLTRLRGGRTTALALRNLLRRRARLALTLVLVAAGGALFTTGLNSAAAWQQWVDDGLARRAYDAELRFTAPVPTGTAIAAARSVADVAAVEPVMTFPATPAGADGRIEVQRTYPDGGHGSFALTGLPADTRMVDFEVTAGGWLRPGDTGTVVLNQGALSRLGDPRIDDEIRLAVDGTVGRWRVVGTVAEVGGPATAYTTIESLAATATATALRIATTGDIPVVTDRVEAALAAAGTPVAETLATSELRQAIDQHVAIFIYTLVALAALMAVVGLLGLASTMSITVTERTREYGIMQAIGATPATVRRLVLAEGTLTGGAGAVLAIILGLPLSVFVGDFLGRLSFGLPLPLQPSAAGLAAWLLLALTGAALATLSAARRAGRLTIRETLTYQ
jgi:putative ABC transport system permease protein